MVKIGPVMAEWIKKGLQWDMAIDGFLDVTPPLTIAAGQTLPILDTEKKGYIEGVALFGSVIANSAFLTFRMIGKEPQIDISWTAFQLNLVGLTVPNEYAWTPRYGTVVVTPFGNLTVFSMSVMNEFYFRNGLRFELINPTGLPINVYLWGILYASLRRGEVSTQ